MPAPKERSLRVAVAVAEGFRMPAPSRTPRACKGPASETLQRCRRPPRPHLTAEIPRCRQSEPGRQARADERVINRTPGGPFLGPPKDNMGRGQFKPI